MHLSGCCECSECQGDREDVLDAPEVLPYVAQQLLPHPTLSYTKCVSPVQPSEAQGSVKVLLKSKGNYNHGGKFRVEHRFFEGCCILKRPGVIYF